MSFYKESFYNIEVDKDLNNRILVYNSYTEATCWFTPNVYESFHNKTKIYEKDLLSDIIRLGFVVNSRIDEVSRVKYEAKKASYANKSERLRLVIAPTMACNYKCIYCFEGQSTNNPLKMNDATIDKTVEFIINQCEEFYDIKFIEIQWFGGEPLLNIETIEKITKKLNIYAKPRKINVIGYIVSNGRLLNKSTALRLKALNIYGVQITMDGMSETYSKMKGCQEKDFYAVLDNIKNIQEIIHVTVRLNIDISNLSEIKELMKFLLVDNELKIKLYLAYIRCYNEYANKTKIEQIDYAHFNYEFTKYANELGVIEKIHMVFPSRHQVACDAGFNHHFVIGPNGALYRCEHGLDKASWEIGNVYDGLYHNQLELDFLNNELPEKCDKCKIMPHCFGGCIADRLIDKKGIDCKARYIKTLDDVKLHTMFQYEKNIV